jgi:hypothetical protein
MQTSRTRLTSLMALLAAAALVATLAGCASTSGIAAGARPEPAGTTVQQPGLTDDVIDASWI